MLSTRASRLLFSTWLQLEREAQEEQQRDQQQQEQLYEQQPYEGVSGSEPQYGSSYRPASADGWQAGNSTPRH